MTDAPQPGNWNQLLQRFGDTLSDMQQRLAKTPDGDASADQASCADAHRAALSKAAKQHAGLDHRIVEITRWVDAIEAELRVSEDLVRVLLTQTEAVRQKLATWAGRSIG